MGKDGNLYFAHLTAKDSRDDYTCNVQYLATRTILAKEPITLTVNPCEFCPGPKIIVPILEQSVTGLVIWGLFGSVIMGGAYKYCTALYVNIIRHGPSSI